MSKIATKSRYHTSFLTTGRGKHSSTYTQRNVTCHDPIGIVGRAWRIGCACPHSFDERTQIRFVRSDARIIDDSILAPYACTCTTISYNRCNRVTELMQVVFVSGLCVTLHASPLQCLGATLSEENHSRRSPLSSCVDIPSNVVVTFASGLAEDSIH